MFEDISALNNNLYFVVELHFVADIIINISYIFYIFHAHHVRSIFSTKKEKKIKFLESKCTCSFKKLKNCSRNKVSPTSPKSIISICAWTALSFIKLFLKCALDYDASKFMLHIFNLDLRWAENYKITLSESENMLLVSNWAHTSFCT